MKRLVIAAALVLFAAAGVRAQDFRYGVTGNLNLSWLHSSLNSSDCYVGFAIGAKGQYDFADPASDGLFLEGRLLYSLKGGAWAGMHQNLGYLELPVGAGYRFRLTDNVALTGSLGPYFAVGVLGKDVVSEDGTKTKTDIFGEMYKRFDFGLNYNIGVEMWRKWQFFLGFEHSLLNIMKSEYTGGDGIKVRPLNLYIGAAYMF